MQIRDKKVRRFPTIALIAACGLQMAAPYCNAQIAESRVHKRLVVSISIDGLRSDLLEAYADEYGADGFRKVCRQGIVYTNASYPYPNVDRASAVTTIATGTTPYYHSIVASRWIDRASLRPVYCVDDSKYDGMNTKDCSSPKNISTSTIGDELKMSTDGKATVYSIAPFRDAAVLAGGHAANGAVWIDDESGKWCSSTYYFSPSPSWLWLYNNGHSIANVLQSDSLKRFYRGEDKYRKYKRSILVNGSITDIALECVKGTEMGTDTITDMLILTYTAGTTREAYGALDKAIAGLVSGVESTIGAGNTLFIITSTGTSEDDDTDYSRFRIPTGSVDIPRAIDLLNLYFGAIYGSGKYIEAGFGNHFFLDHKLIEQKRITLTDATTHAKELLLQLSGVRNVYTNLQILSSDNEHTNRIRNGYHPDRCGDVIIEVQPGWKIVNEPWGEVTFSKYSHLQFPIIIYGADKEHESISTPVTVDRIAPTIAKTIRIRAPNGCASEALY